MNDFDTIEISKEDFVPLLKWCLIKFKLDPSSRQGTGGREDKIGGFIDRFSNSCVNWVVFNHLLRNDRFKVDPDYFFYNKKSAKKCADIIGLKGQNGKLVPFTYFDKNQWIHLSDAPFVEVKTLRKTQSLTSLGLPQFDRSHYFVYVESDFDELYIYNFLNDINNNHFDMKMDQSYIRDNSENVILQPNLHLPNKIATLRLLGIYKGDELEKHDLKFREKEKPRYLKSISPITLDQIPSRSKELSTPITDDIFTYNPNKLNRSDFLPIYTKGNCIEIKHAKRQTVGKVYISVKQPCNFNEHKLELGYYELNFKPLDRHKNETELINYKAVYDQSIHRSKIFPNDCTNELIHEMRAFFNKKK